MTRAGARLARLEAQAEQQRAATLARNTERVVEALSRMTAADLRRIRDGTDTGDGWACPWEDVPPGLPEDARAAWEWAGVMHGLTRAQVWPLPPAGAAGVFEQEAVKLKAADPVRLTWPMLSKLAQVTLAEA